ncbi:MAG: hypothetical protein GY774_34230 [Planctomycetes bacterium]|nr:hypothetical protein [Planctomycetota bacterium]
MIISEVTQKLDELKDIHGDVQFCINDADTGWIFEVWESSFKFVEDEKGKRIEVGATYGDEI